MYKKLIICLIVVFGLLCFSPVIASESNLDVNSLTQTAGFFDWLFPASVDIDNIYIENLIFEHTYNDGKVEKSNKYFLYYDLNENENKELLLEAISYDKSGKIVAVNNESLDGFRGQHFIELGPASNIVKSTLLVYDGDLVIFNETTTEIKKTTQVSDDTKQPETSSSSSSASSSSSGQTYWASSNSNKFHYPGCEWAQKISSRNKIVFHSRDEALNSGYVPCQVCGP